MHSRCWEVLQGIEIVYSQKTGHVGRHTQNSLDGGIQGDRASNAVACHGKPAACRSFRWLDHAKVEHLHEQWVRPIVRVARKTGQSQRDSLSL